MIRAWAIGFLLAACAPGAEAPRIDEQRVIVTDAPKSNYDGYLLAVRSPLSSLGILRADGLDRQATESFGKTLAHAIESCVTREFSRGFLTRGAARLDVSIDEAGRIAHIEVMTEPASGHTGASLCVVTPLHTIGFGQGTARSISLEVLWGVASK